MLRKILIAALIALMLAPATALAGSRGCRTSDMAGVWRYTETLVVKWDGIHDIITSNCWMKFDHKGHVVGLWGDVAEGEGFPHRRCMYRNWVLDFPYDTVSLNRNCAGKLFLDWGAGMVGYFQLDRSKSVAAGTGWNWDIDGSTDFQLIKSDRLSRMNWQGPRHAR